MISKATSFDIPFLHHLINRAYRGESSRSGWTTEADLLDGQRIDPQMLQEMIKRTDSTLWTTWHENKLCGCMNLIHQNSALEENIKCLYLGLLTVDPLRQNLGLGKKMLHWAENQGRLMGVKHIEMTVIDRRRELISWYVRKGYIETSTFIPFPKGDQFGIHKTELKLQVLFKTI